MSCNNCFRPNEEIPPRPRSIANCDAWQARHRCHRIRGPAARAEASSAQRSRPNHPRRHGCDRKTGESRGSQFVDLVGCQWWIQAQLGMQRRENKCPGLVMVTPYPLAISEVPHLCAAELPLPVERHPADLSQFPVTLDVAWRSFHVRAPAVAFHNRNVGWNQRVDNFRG